MKDTKVQKVVKFTPALDIKIATAFKDLHYYVDIEDKATILCLELLPQEEMNFMHISFFEDKIRIETTVDNTSTNTWRLPDNKPGTSSFGIYRDFKYDLHNQKACIDDFFNYLVDLSVSEEYKEEFRKAEEILNFVLRNA